MKTVYWIEKKRNPFASWERNRIPYFSEKEAKDHTVIVEWDRSGFSVQTRIVPETAKDDEQWAHWISLCYSKKSS